MSDLIQAVKGTALSVAEYFTPVLKQSKFKQTGVLTPEEFVIAGDHLVHQCPTWSWSPAPEPSMRKSYLPESKQFLVTKSVPCYKRCKDIEHSNSDEKLIMTENDDEGWIDTHHSEQSSDPVEELTIGGESKNDQICNNLNQSGTSNFGNNPSATDCADDDTEAEDMDRFMDMVEESDTSTAPLGQPLGQQTSGKCKSDFNSCETSKAAGDSQNSDRNEQDNIIATRTYDLNVTYDKYYQTPRLWLVGYDENLKPLSIEDMYQDISQDHAKKTVTMETHPHIPTVMASVHPCRHAEAMKKIISTVEDGGHELQVYSYLIVFLKLVQSVVPTLEYDFTQNFTM